MPKNEQLKRAIEAIKAGFEINQEVISEKLGVRDTYLSDMINGRVPLSGNVTEKIYELFQVKIGQEQTNQFLNQIPLLPISAQAGSLNDFIVSVKDSECEQIISPIKGADFAITVSGESMAPEFSAGSQILVKKINEKAFIDWGKTYVLDTCNGALVKRLYPPENGAKDKIKCVSINPAYPPFEVDCSDIYGVYRVMMCLSVK